MAAPTCSTVMPSERLLLLANGMVVMVAIKLSGWLANRRNIHEIDEENMQNEEMEEENVNEEKEKVDQEKVEDDADKIYSNGLEYIRKENSYPGWVNLVGSHERSFVLLTSILVLFFALALSQRPPNYFEIVGLHPTRSRDPMAGSYIVRTLRQGIDPAFGLSQEQTSKLTETMRDVHLRSKYELYGSIDTPIRTFSDIFSLLTECLLYYTGWCSFLVLVSSFSSRIYSAYESGLVLAGILMFLDLSVSLEQSSIRDNAMLSNIPGIGWMTTFERLCYLRHLALPPVFCACILYAGYTYVDYPTEELKTILRLEREAVRSYKSMETIKKVCQIRRDVLQKAEEAVSAKARGEEGSSGTELRQRKR